MRTFVRYNSGGDVVSVTRVEVMPKNLEQPYMDLGPGESVVELSEGSPHAKLDLLELHNEYKVDVKTKQMFKRSR